MEPPAVRQRGKKQRSLTPSGRHSGEDEPLLKTPTKSAKGKTFTVPSYAPSQKPYSAALVILTVLAFITRFWMISHPNEVVFDEVHFGKFASYYLQGTYFFDVHPPFAKLLFAGVGWLIGYDGHFLFDNIGDSYIKNNVPYVSFRALPAMLSTLTVPVVFMTMWESGYSLPACVTAAGIVVFDNAHIGQTRLILLDSTLIFSMAVSLLAYVRFYKHRHVPFSRKWWKWLLVTGLALSCVISTKYVGVFTFLTIGAAVAIDLWNLLDIKRGLTLVDFGKHFAARTFGLIVVPFFMYLFWFQVHFSVLSRSGPGDDFMSPEFQETLSDNLMSLNSVQINYFDTIVLRHKETKTYLHSHPDRYPLRYDDGRVSSQGQQVTGYPFNDTNNHWVIMPADPFAEGEVANKPIKNHALIKLKHVVTNTILLSHDVASPWYPTNQEFTTVSLDDADGKRHNDTVFEIRMEGAKQNALFKTLAGQFKLIHYPSKVAMWTQNTKPLPEWGFKQQEINGNKKIAESSNIWFTEEIPSIKPDDARLQKKQKKIKTMPFWKKYIELQRKMFHHNNALTSSHPYASQPIQWPFLLRGVSFWTKNDTREQIYFLGNPVGWWIASSILAVFIGIIAADQLTLRRGLDTLDTRTRKRLYNSTGFFFIAWAAHYLPFFLMGRQLFLHHYLPAHLASAMVAGAVMEFVFCLEPLDADKNHPRKTKRENGAIERQSTQSLVGPWLATLAILSLIIACFFFYAPLTYGTPGLSVEAVVRRKLLGYDLHFAK